MSGVIKKLAQLKGSQVPQKKRKSAQKSGVVSRGTKYSRMSGHK